MAFSNRGFDGTRVEAIAKEAGYSYGSVYYYYKSKEILYHMTVQRAMELSVSLFHRGAEKADAFKQLESFLLAYQDMVNTPQGASSLLLLYDVLTSASVPDITRIYVKDKFSWINTNLKSIIACLPEQGFTLRHSPDEIVRMINSMMIGNAFLKISRLETPLSIDSVMSFIIDR